MVFPLLLPPLLSQFPPFLFRLLLQRLRCCLDWDFSRFAEDELVDGNTQGRRQCQQLPDGQILFVPLKDDRSMTPEEVQQLSPEELEDLENRQQKLIDESSKVLGKQQEMERKLSSEVREVAQKFAARIIDPLVDELSKQYESEKLQNWFSRLKEHLVEHIDRFRERGTMPPSALIAAMGGLT